MAQKRMFSLSVTDTDRFTDMPTSSQALYFHLGMHGDDDGFVSSPKKIMRAIGCNEDDLTLLIAKGFIYSFASGIVVITDWKVNNTLKNDRYHETIYTAEKATLELDKTGRYFLHGIVLEPEWIQLGSSLEPEHNITEHSINNTVQMNHDEPVQNQQFEPHLNQAEPVQEPQFELFWTAYPKKQKKKDAQKAWDSLNMNDTLFAAVMDGLNRWKQAEQWNRDSGQFIPLPATWLRAEQWNDEVQSETQTGLPAEW